MSKIRKATVCPTGHSYVTTITSTEIRRAPGWDCPSCEQVNSAWSRMLRIVELSLC